MFLNEWLVWSSSHHSSPAQSTLTGRLCMFVPGPRHNRVHFLETFPAGRHTTASQEIRIQFSAATDPEISFNTFHRLLLKYYLLSSQNLSQLTCLAFSFHKVGNPIQSEMVRKYFFFAQIRKSLFLSVILYCYYHLFSSLAPAGDLFQLPAGYLGNCSRRDEM